MAEPSLTVAVHEKKKLSEALVGADMGQFGSVLESMTRGVVRDCIDTSVAREVYEENVAGDVIRKMLREEVVPQALLQAAHE